MAPSRLVQSFAVAVDTLDEVEIELPVELDNLVGIERVNITRHLLQFNGPGRIAKEWA